MAFHLGGNSMRLSLRLWTLVVAIAMSAMGCAQHAHNLPPAERLMEPGPGVGGPGPGVLPPVVAPSAPAGMVPMMARPTVQVLFAKPDAMQVRWNIGRGGFGSEPLVVPGRQNFGSAGIYMLKITNIEGREGVELYPSLEVGPITPRTEAFLAHNAIPVQFTEEDFDQVMSGNFVTKVIYLPDPEFQEMALAGVETLVSTRLDPGVDPIVEADRRGAIMAVIRLGNKDVEMPGMQAGGVMQASFPQGAPGMHPGMMMPMQMGATGMPNNYISGMTAPQYGMPFSGTPIGLPGPPHIPMGAPAGLTKHVMRNHTPMHIPSPPHKFKIHVRENPGYSYPTPPSRMSIRSQHIHPPQRYGQPWHDKLQQVY